MKKLTGSIAALGCALVFGGCVPADEAGDCVTEVSNRIEPGTVWGDECKTIALLEYEAIYEGNLTILPGTRIVVSDDQQLDITENGTVTAIGTADEPIIMEAESGQAGSWFGFHIKTDSADNVVEHLVIRHTGAEGGTTGGPEEAIKITGSVTMDNITFEDTAGGGIELATADASMNASNLTFRNVDRWPIQTTFANAHDVPTSMTLENVREEYVSIDRGALAAEVTWEALPVPYRLMGNESTGTIDESGALTITEGVEVEMGQNEYFIANQGATLTVSGTADAPVIFRGAEDIPGFWRNIVFLSASTDNVIENAVIRNGGASGYAGKPPASVGIFGGAVLQDVAIEDGEGAGVFIGVDASLATLENVTYSVGGDNVIDER